MQGHIFIRFVVYILIYMSPTLGITDRHAAPSINFDFRAYVKHTFR